MLVSKLLIKELVVNVYFSGLSATRVFINGHITNQIKAHFSCKLRSSCILTQTAHELVHIGFVLLVSLFTL